MSERYIYTVFKKTKGEGQPVIIDLMTGSERKKDERIRQLSKWGYIAVSLERKSSIPNDEDYGTNIQEIEKRLRVFESIMCPEKKDVDI